MSPIQYFLLEMNLSKHLLLLLITPFACTGKPTKGPLGSNSYISSSTAMNTYGRDVQSLLFHEIERIIKSENFYAGGMSKSHFKTNNITSQHHPYSLATLIECILRSDTTPREKETLWGLLLYHTAAKSTITYNRFGHFVSAKMNYSLGSCCKYGLRNFMPSEHQKQREDVIIGCTAIGLFTLFWTGLLRLFYLTMFHSHQRTITTPSIHRGFVRVESRTEFNTGVYFWNKTWPTLGFLIGAAYGYYAAQHFTTTLPSSTYAKRAEEILKIHVSLVESLDKSIPEFPRLFAKNLEALKRELYDEYDAPEGLNQEMLEEYLSNILLYYKRLAQQ